jgi:hypothetical protein
VTSTRDQGLVGEGIDYFGRGHWLTSVQVRMSVAARRRMFARWRDYAGDVAGRSVLDVGSTPDRERQDSNCMIPWFEAHGLLVSLYSPENILNLAEAFPRATIVPSAGFGTPIPVRDGSFSWVASSAVLEHVGGPVAQVAFVRECARVANGLFLTTPNRWHWLEFHTKLPLLHWLPRPLHRALLRALGKEEWSLETHLRLVDRRELEGIAAAALGNAFDFEVTSVRTLGMSSNLVLLARRRAPSH